ncbi:hypothetical protein GCM10010232_33880 [Streptomyces amakusaensis]
MTAWPTSAARICPSERWEEVEWSGRTRCGAADTRGRKGGTGRVDGTPVTGADDPQGLVRGDEGGVGLDRATGGDQVAVSPVDADARPGTRPRAACRVAVETGP